MVGLGERLAKSKPSGPPTIEAIARDIAQDAFHARPHLDALAKLLEDAVQDVAADRRSRKIVVSMPPGQGKSATASVALPIHMLANHPRWNIGVISSELTLATKFSRDARREAPMHNVKIAPDISAVTEWETTDGGGLIARGVGGSLTGRRLKALIMDDPIKDPRRAYSEKERKALWDWYQAVAKTRLAPVSLSLCVMCMTGDTPVLRPDGTETELRHIRPGDEIATYDNGRVATSTVRNWANQGIDAIYSIKMTSGVEVRANARHPFLTITEDGKEQWTRLSDLKPGMRILHAASSPAAQTLEMQREGCAHLTTTGTARKCDEDSERTTRPASIESAQPRGEATPANSVRRTDAINRPGREGCATPTTARPAPLPGSKPHHRILKPTGHAASSIGTESPLLSTTPWSSDSKDYARSAAAHQHSGTPVLIGTGNSASITTTTPAACEDCSATTATLPLATDAPRITSSQPLSTYAAIPDTIASVKPCGYADVFDIEVERTENFIANGLVSHNTRWHEDDIAAQLVKAGWEEFRLPALAEDNDPIGRAPGEPLLTPQAAETPEEALARWSQEREEVGEHVWAGLYQQRPAPAGGAIFNPDQLLDAPEDLDLAIGTWITSWDLSFGGNGDYTVGTVWQRTPDLYILHDIIRGRWEFTQQKAAIVRTAARYPQCSRHLVEKAANGAAMVNVLHDDIPGITPIKPLGGKVERWQACTPLIEAGKVATVGGAWLQDLRGEMVVAPNGSHDDQLDSLAQGLNWLRLRIGGVIETRPPSATAHNPLRGVRF